MNKSIKEEKMTHQDPKKKILKQLEKRLEENEGIIIGNDILPYISQSLDKYAKECANEIEKNKISVGYIIPYTLASNKSVESMTALERQVHFTTASFETTYQLSQIYTEGFNAGLEKSQRIIVKESK